MPNKNNFPTAYDKFLRTAKLGIENRQIRLNLRRFTYRYRLAESFQGLIAPDVGRTLLGYDVITKIFLTNAAYELIVKTALLMKIRGIRSVNDCAIFNEKIAVKIRNNLALKEFLLTYPDHSIALRTKLVMFFGDKTSDVTGVMYAIRNIFAHGELTATAIGTETKEKRNVLLDLADEVLDHCDELFTKCVDKL